MTIKRKPLLLSILLITVLLSCSDLFNNEQEGPYRFAEKEYYYERGEKVYVERSLDFILPALKSGSDPNDKRSFISLVSEYDLGIFTREDFKEINIDSISTLTDFQLDRTRFSDFIFKVPEDENLDLFYTNNRSFDNFGNNELLQFTTPLYRYTESKEWLYVGNRLYIETDPDNQIPAEIVSKYNLEERENYVVTTKAFYMRDMITFKPIETVRRIYEENDYENVRPSRLFLFDLLNE